MKKIQVASCFFLSIFLVTTFSVPVSGHRYYQAHELNVWNIGKPWQPIEFGVDIENSEVDVQNVTFYYSLNEMVEEEGYTKELMTLKNGTVRNGFWNYTLEGQENGTTIYYAYKVYFEDGSYQGPEYPLYNPYSYRVFYPPKKFELTSFEMRNLDPISLTVDLRCGFNIVYWSDADSIPVTFWNKGSENYFTQTKVVNVSQAGKNNRYYFREIVDINNFTLSGDGTDFPFDEYFLDVEFELYYLKNITYSLRNEGNYRYFPEQTFDVSFTRKPEVIGNSSEIQKIGFKVELTRTLQNFVSIISPIVMMLSVIGASLLIDPKKHLEGRLTIYTALFVFALTFSNFNIPSKFIGGNFTEASYLYASIIAGIFSFFSIIEHFWSESNHTEIAISSRFDFLAISLSSILWVFFVVSQYTVFSGGLTQRAIFIIFQLVFILLLFSSPIIKFIFNLVHRKKKKTYQSKLFII